MHYVCMVKTMIRIDKEIRDMIKQEKKYSRDTYNDILKRMFKKRKKVVII